MDQEEFKKKEEEILNHAQSEIRTLRANYIKDKSKFNVGDFIYNVTGIIKVDKITSERFLNDIEIIYQGYRYRKIKGELVRTKSNSISSMWESHDLKSLTVKQ